MNGCLREIKCIFPVYCLENSRFKVHTLITTHFKKDSVKGKIVAMNTIEIESIIRRGATFLSECIYTYWPSNGNNEIPEANITMHLGHSFIEKGFITFAEAHTKDSVKNRIDFLAIHPSRGILVLGEFKRIYSSEKLKSSINDVKKIYEFKPQRPPRCDERLKIKNGYGFIAGTTWDPKYAEWWNAEDVDDPSRDNVFDDLLKKINNENANWGSVVLGSEYDKNSGKTIQHWLLYVLFPINIDTF